MMVAPPLLDRLASFGRDLGRFFAPRHVDPSRADERIHAAEAARQAGRHGEAVDLYRRVIGRRSADPAALGGLREAALAAGRFPEAVEAQQRLLAGAAPAARAGEADRLASIQYEWARAELDGGRPEAAIPPLKGALRAVRDFIPAAVALGEAQVLTGDVREAVRTWERALESRPSLPILARLERVYRDEGRPTRMIALYRRALERAPDDLALAVALGRVYLELEMLDEAADQLEAVEARAPDLPIVHAYLATVFEHRGEWREACAEYRRALQLGRTWDWPHRCALCGSAVAGWQDRCPSCRRWNSLRPAES
jgi:lipopolysaccharide biosynthesis regulator YciM